MKETLALSRRDGARSCCGCHPQLYLLDLTDGCQRQSVREDCFLIVVHPSSGGMEPWGWKPYDFTEACLSFHLPHRHPRESRSAGMAVMFHPDLFAFTSLALRFSDFTFFHYRETESLHLSSQELRVVEQVLEDMRSELQWGVDTFTKPMLCNKLESLLLYCQRFYQRQFTTRRDGCSCLCDKVIAETDRLLLSGGVKTDALYDAAPLAERLDISTAYLDDLVKFLTGKNLAAYTQLRKIELAKQMLSAGRMTDLQIVRALGYASEKHFRCLFQRLTDTSTDDHRR